MKNRPGSLPKRQSKNKWEINTQKIGKIQIWDSKWVPEGGYHYALFSCFSFLGHPWGPKWPQDPFQELLGLPGPHFFVILGRFFIVWASKWHPKSWRNHVQKGTELLVQVEKQIKKWPIVAPSQAIPKKDTQGFRGLGVSPRHGGGARPQGSWVYIYISMYIYMYIYESCVLGDSWDLHTRRWLKPAYSEIPETWNFQHNFKQ